MAILQQKDADTIRSLFAKELRDPVKLAFFTQGESPLDAPSHECRFCQDERELLTELTALNSHLTLEVTDFVASADVAQARGIDQIPALELTGHAKGRVRYIGIPAGYEFSSLIEDIVDLSKGTTRLAQATREALAKLTRPVHIQVFVTPT
ncbi:MAG TPA: hypothetical protein VGK74_23920 [Symbiobacteriaceae bacterium]|jgi:alkyl hydroperoxide reductase subunit AhpF